MKNKKIISIFGFITILSLLFAVLPVLPAYTVVTRSYTITIDPNQGDIGTSVTLKGVCSPAPIGFMEANIYFSPNNLSIGANFTSAQTYTRLITPITIQTVENVGILAGNFTATFTIPGTIPSSNNSMVSGTVAKTVSVGTYYIYITITTISGTTAVVAKATYTLTQPTLAPLSTSSGPAGTNIAISGSYFPKNAPLAFKFETTTLTPTDGDTSHTKADGSFFSYITIPGGYDKGSHTIYVTVGTGSSAITVSATFTVTGTITPTIDSITPETGVAGTSVEITGSNFPPNEVINVSFDDYDVNIIWGDTTTSTAGDFDTRITIPSDADARVHIIKVTAGASSDFKYFTVVATQTTTPPPVLNTPIDIDPTSGSVNSTIGISGSSFLANHAITITFSGTQVKQTTTDETGHFLTSFQVPSKPSGNNTVSATDGTNTGTKTFIIESTTPPIPPPQRPLMGEAASSPVTFDWDNVTDLSMPITYKLQVATSANFDTDSLIINKSGITDSQYTLTADEMKKLSTGVTYYWREKAVDAAFNESAWTGANEFSVAKGFDFSGWPLYLVIGIGALFLFLLGIWLGRKTAYSYY